jgi:beta-mannosidase
LREWGWSSRPKEVIDGYREFFMKMIPAMLAKEDPDKSYINSSPLGSQWNGESGDVHYWAVWWGGAGIEFYQ